VQNTIYGVWGRFAYQASTILRTFENHLKSVCRLGPKSGCWEIGLRHMSLIEYPDFVPEMQPKSIVVY
jgi:hypothetical protein